MTLQYIMTSKLKNKTIRPESLQLKSMLYRLANLYTMCLLHDHCSLMSKKSFVWFLNIANYFS